MQTKPFSVQSSEDIAKQYGGNKQKIAQAMKSGVVDLTAGLLAGMFIDRMRSAQAQEMGQQPTVAQQVMAPPPAPAAPMGMPGGGGLGAIAPGGASAAPAAPAAPPAPPPGGAPMAMASGGLASLPVPDDMFSAGDETGYAGGGIVAFADGGETPAGTEEERLRQQMQMMQRLTGAPPQAGYMDQMLAEQDKNKRYDTGLALLQMAAGVTGSKSRNVLAALGEGVAAGIPTLQKSEEGRRAARLEADKLKFQNDLAKYNADVAAFGAASATMTAKEKAAFEKDQFATETRLKEEANRIAKIAATREPRLTDQERYLQGDATVRADIERYAQLTRPGLAGLPFTIASKAQQAEEDVRARYAADIAAAKVRVASKREGAPEQLEALMEKMNKEILAARRPFEAAAGVDLTPTTGAGAGAGTTGIELIGIRPGT